MDEQEVIRQLTYWSLSKEEDSPLWQGYTPDIIDLKAIELFEQKYGYKPKTQKRYASILLVGPIFEESQK